MMKGLLWLAGFCGLVAVGGLIGFYVYAHLIFGFTLTDQPGHVLLPPTATIRAEATNKITINLNGYIDATVPFKDTLALPLKGIYDTDIKLNTNVPVKMVIRYKGVVPVDTYADIEGTTDFTYQDVKRLRNVKFKARVPLKFEQPVSFVVPIDTKIKFAYQGPVKMAVDQTITAPVDTVLKTRIKAQQDVTTPILASFGLKAYIPQTPIPVIIKHSDLKLRLNTLRLEKAVSSSSSEPVPNAVPASLQQQ